MANLFSSENMGVLLIYFCKLLIKTPINCYLNELVYLWFIGYFL